MPEPSAAVRSELAPTGTLRVGLNMSNFLLTRTDEATGKPAGVARRSRPRARPRVSAFPSSSFPIRIPARSPTTRSPASGTSASSAPSRSARTRSISPPPTCEIEATYLVPPGSPLKSVEEVDREGIRIAVPTRSAYELYLTRTLKHAKLVHEKGADNAFKRLAGRQARRARGTAAAPRHRSREAARARASWTGASPPCSRPRARPRAAARARSICASSSRTSRRSGLVAKTHREEQRARPDRRGQSLSRARCGICRSAVAG